MPLTRTEPSGSGTSPMRAALTRARRVASPTPASTWTRRRPPRGRAGSGSTRGLGEVVDGHAVDCRGREVLLDPLGDRTRCTAAASRAAARSEEVVDATLRDVLLELSE